MEDYSTVIDEVNAGRKPTIKTIIGIAVVAVAAVGLAVLLILLLGGSWKKTLDRFIKAGLNGFNYYPTEYLENLEDEYDLTRKEMKEIINEYLKDVEVQTVDEYEILDEERVDKKEIRSISQRLGIDGISEGVNVKVSELYYEYDEIDESVTTIMMVKVKGKWFVCPVEDDDYSSVFEWLLFEALHH